jgi:hypothetical protein
MQITPLTARFRAQDCGADCYCLYAAAIDTPRRTWLD